MKKDIHEDVFGPRRLRVEDRFPHIKKIDFGCGMDNLKGYLHVDKFIHAPHIDFDYDLDYDDTTNGVIFPREFYEEVRMFDVLEHLHYPVQVVDFAWELLIPGGMLKLKVPAWDSHHLWDDMTHLRGFTEQSLDYFVAGTFYANKYPMYSKNKFRLSMAVKRTDEETNLLFTLIK